MPTETDTNTRECDAQVVIAQIGRWTLMSLGARRIVDLGHGVRFAAGRSNRWIEVILNANDTYTAQVVRVKRGSLERIVMEAVDTVYCDQLAEVLIGLGDRHL